MASKSISAVFALACVLSSCRTSPVALRNLRCDGRENAAGVAAGGPRFSWEIVSDERGQGQSAYQIRVAARPGNPSGDKYDVWDSGKRASAKSAFVPYGGPELAAGTEYAWKVRIWDAKGRPTGWSEPASFITGLPGVRDWEGARWIAYEELPDSLKVVPGVHGSGDHLEEAALRRPVIPLFRKEFEVSGEVRKAVAFVSGLGHYELRVNGKKAGDSFLAPGWTDYRRTCLYNVLDVTSLVRKGRNAVGLIAGNGFFNINRERYRKLVIAHGMPTVIVKLGIEYASGTRETVVSGPDWKTDRSPITFSSIYGGEDYDARLEQPGWDMPSFDDAAWKNAISSPGPGGTLKAESDYPLKIMETFESARVTEPRKGIFVYDFGQNASGIIRLAVKGRSGRRVKMVPGELLDPAGCVTQKASGWPYYFLYTLKGAGEEEWTPRFTYYGFRYVQVENAVPDNWSARSGRRGLEEPPGKTGAGPGNAADEIPRIVRLHLLHTRNSAPAAGRFECSNELFNRIFSLIRWAVRSNLASVPTDCPHREKLGWLEQTYLMGNSIQYNVHVQPLYTKLVGDMMEAQLENGLVPDIAPEFVPFDGGFRDSPEWGSAAVILPWRLYKWYGTTEAMERAYPMMQRYAAYLGAKAQGHILSHGLGDWYDLGPNPPGESQLTPIALTATATYYHDLDLLSRMAGILGRSEDAGKYRRLAADVRGAFNERFFDRDAKIYATGSQTSMAMPLCLGLAEEGERKAVFDNLVRSIEKDGKALTAGDIGFHYLVKALEEGGANELIYEMNSRSDVPGYGYQLAKGATALTESWPAREDVSNNHMMLGHIMEWFYTGLAGIRQSGDSAGFDKVVIDPHPVGDISWAKARHHSVRGEIASDWRIRGGRFMLDVRIPAGARALVHMPASDAADVLEGGRPASEAEAVRFAGTDAGRAVFEVGSGKYRFESRVPDKK